MRPLGCVRLLRDATARAASTNVTSPGMDESSPADRAAPLAESIEHVRRSGSTPGFVGLDGRSGSAKSTLARALADLLAADGPTVTIIEGDDFYAGGSAATWDAGDVILLEGAYSCRPELHDLLDLRVLLDVPTDVRRRQLLEREGEHYRVDWEGRWSAAEAHYFGTIMPPTSFDLVPEFA